VSLRKGTSMSVENKKKAGLLYNRGNGSFFVLRQNPFKGTRKIGGACSLKRYSSPRNIFLDGGTV